MEKPKQNPNSLLTLPKRPKDTVQSKFRKIIIQTNRFKVDVSKLNWLCIFAYRFTPNIKEQKKSHRQDIIQNITPQIRQFITEPIFKDGLIFSHHIPKTSDKTILHGEYVITIRQIKRFDANKEPQMLLYFLGNVMRKVMQKLSYIQVSNTRKFIDVKRSFQIQNVFIFSGFKVNFELLQNGCFLTVDTTKKIVRNQSVLEFINYLYKSNENLQRDERRQLVRKSLINCIIMTNYGKSRYLRIDDVLFTDLTQVVVQSYKMLLPDYYKLKYDVQIKSLKQPLILANSKKATKVYLVPQLCLMTGIPENFDESKNKSITETARCTAQQRKIQIQNFVQNMNKYEGDLIFPALGVKIQSKCQKIQAKLIPAPKILLGQNRSVQAGRQANFSFQDLPILKIKQKIKLAIVSFQNIDYSTIIQYFTKTFKTLKIKLEICVLKADNQNKSRSVDTMYNFIELAKQKENCNVCLIIIPNKMSHIYTKLKQIALLEKEISCQVVLQRTLKIKNLQSVALKILLQILAKTGNTLWASVPQSNKQKIMIVAYYTTELTKIKSSHFLMSICATCDNLQTQIFSKTCKYSKQHQQLHSMKQLLFQALTAYKKKNGFTPQNIIILQNQKPSRNQSSTIQFYIEPCIQLMQQFYGLKRPKIIFVWVRKSLNDRFFRSFEGKSVNPPIGTLINGHVTLNKNDFYIIAHNVMRTCGSISPINYKIIYTDSNLEYGIVQSLLFSQCFSYANYSGAIKIPAIIQYATKCTKFGAQVLSNADVPDKFRMFPYYI